MEEKRKAAEAAGEQDKNSNYIANSQQFETPSQAIAANIESISKSTSKIVGHYEIQRMNDVIAEAKQMPNPTDFYRGLWYEGSLGCLFGQSFLGKSILAMQIGEEIAKYNPSKQVGYIDCELNPKQIQSRYDNGMSSHIFPDNLFRLSLNRIGLDYTGDYTKSVIDTFKDLISQTDTRIFIVDNLTAIVPDAEKGPVAAGFMNQMKGIVAESKLSVLFVAHTPKIPYHKELSAADLAGGHQLFALFDDVFAIGKSIKGQDIRYIKQLKCRGPQGAIYQQEGQVLTYQVGRGNNGDYLHFEETGLSTEADHLPSKQDSEAIIQDVWEMKKSGMSYRDIEKLVPFGRSKVGEILNKTRAKDNENEQDGRLL